MRSGAGGDVKSFFRQQKSHSGAAAAIKPDGGVSKRAASRPRHVAARPFDLTPDPGAGGDARREEEEEDRERAVLEFDMDMRYGPCLGLTRAQRWRRAAALGLAPPSALCSDDEPCLWEGRV